MRSVLVIHYEARKSLVHGIVPREFTRVHWRGESGGGRFLCSSPPSSSPVAVFGMSCAICGAVLAGLEPHASVRDQIMPPLEFRSCVRLVRAVLAQGNAYPPKHDGSRLESRQSLKRLHSPKRQPTHGRGLEPFRESRFS